MTKLDRQIAATRLAKKFNQWIKMSDDELFAQVKAMFPIVSSASRDECIKMLAMEYVYIQFQAGL